MVPEEAGELLPSFHCCYQSQLFNPGFNKGVYPENAHIVILFSPRSKTLPFLTVCVLQPQFLNAGSQVGDFSTTIPWKQKSFMQTVNSWLDRPQDPQSSTSTVLVLLTITFFWFLFKHPSTHGCVFTDFRQWFLTNGTRNLKCVITFYSNSILIRRAHFTLVPQKITSEAWNAKNMKIATPTNY